jgi:hypothetical protein
MQLRYWRRELEDNIKLDFRETGLDSLSVI